MSHIRVKRKGQVTIPAKLRRKFKIEEGSLLGVEERKEGILLKLLPPMRSGNVVGEKTYKEIIHELDESRRKKWR